jgi:glycosyltransferase involved in cell wall biosynthesis
MTRRELVIWFNSPPKVERGAFNHVTTAWGSRVTFVCAQGLRDERKLLGWDDNEFGLAEVLTPRADQGAREFLTWLIGTRPDAIHMFAGFSGRVGDYLREYVQCVGDGQAIVYSERPGAYGPRMKRLIRKFGMPLKQWMIRREFEASVRVLLPLGQAGVARFARAGWPPEKMMPFMYCPDVRDETTGASEALVLPQPTKKDLKFLYVGRFSRYTKGTDTLIAATNRLDPGGWSLTMVGGYGDLKDQTVEWCESNPNVTYSGSWTPEVLAQKMFEYDVCVIPSRFDGWNVVVNEALIAGIGVISTDQTVSHELVRRSGAGTVVKADNPAALAREMMRVITVPALADEWRARARTYREFILPSTVGDYLIDVLDFVFDDSQRRPRCPWL